MKKRILFIIPSLKAGGAERVISFLVSKLDKSEFECVLIVLGFQKDTVYNVQNLRVTYLNKPRLIRSIPSIIKAILNIKPQIVFSSIGHVNILMGVFTFFFRKIKFIAREASVITTINQYGGRPKNVPSKVIKILYSRFSKIVCQSNDMRNDFIENFKLPPNKLVVINNPITKIYKEQDSVFVKENKVDVKFITVGRLCKEKGYERILKGLSKIKNYSFQYLIIGSGELAPNIRVLAKKFNIEEKISYIPFTDKVLEYLAGSDFFIQGSYVEGFPNALLESYSVGTPAIVFNCPGGTKEIVNNGINGYLADDENDFEKKLVNIDKNRYLFNRERVKNSVRYKFSSEKILLSYKKMFLSV